MVPEAADRLEAADLEPGRATAPLSTLRVWRALHARLMRGQPGAAHEVLQGAAASEALVPFLAEHAVRLHVAGYLPASELEPWLPALERESTQDANFWLGVLAMHRGDLSGVEAHADAIERASPPLRAPLSDAPPQYATVLRMLARLTAGDTTTLRRLEQALPTLPTKSARRDHVASFVRSNVGQWLLDHGHTAAAERYLRSITHYEAFEYLPAQLALATIDEVREDTAAARSRYQLVLDWWRDAEDAFQPLRAEASAGLERIGSAPS
ncbi:MAG: hypothetical protein CVV17_07770 [Gammaproteobacteria bacterium HGW-Gammaproteobacteria-7]|nr:MAG: hypothetical protein CVV17_07770 [Gammaproteobacteria bacterium HGW-Gammaproteobacteria-7]